MFFFSIFESKFSANLLSAREISGASYGKEITSTEFLANRFELKARVTGHLMFVFCVAFDQTGNFVITVKINLIIN